MRGFATTTTWDPNERRTGTTGCAGHRDLQRRGRAVLRDAARRHGRRRRQGRASRGGDTLRSWPPISDGFSENFASLNRNKRSVTLDLKNPGDVALRARLVRRRRRADREQPARRDGRGSASATRSSSREQPAARLLLDLGLRPDRTARAGGRLRPHRAGDERHHERDRRARRRAGEVRRAARRLRRRPLRRVQHRRRRCARVRAAGRARTSTCRCSARRSASRRCRRREYFGSGRDPEAARLGASAQRAVSGVQGSADGYFVMAAGNNTLWRAVCTTIDRCRPVRDDARFRHAEQRARHQDALRELLEGEFASARRRHWLDAFRAAGVPCAPINTYSQVLADRRSSTWAGCSR